jgi:hypothetical protein
MDINAFSNGPISRLISALLGVDDALTASPPSRSLTCLEIEPLTIQGFFSSLLEHIRERSSTTIAGSAAPFTCCRNK